MQHTLFGHATDKCKIDSFLRLLPPRKRECVSRALKGDGPFPTGEIIDLLKDYSVCQLPTGDNIKSLVLSIAIAEFVTTPFLCYPVCKKEWAKCGRRLPKERMHRCTKFPGQPQLASLQSWSASKKIRKRIKSFAGWNVFSKDQATKFFFF